MLSKEVFSINLAICDDNIEFLTSFREVLIGYCAKKDWDCHIAIFSEASKLLETDLSGYHVLFLDIEMPGINGLESGKQLRQRYPDMLIVFVTAFLEYAPAGYRVRAFRYLLKDHMLDKDLDECLSGAWQELYVRNESVVVQDVERTQLRIRLKDILYLEGTPNRHTIFHLANADGRNNVLCLGQIKDFEAQLRDHGFTRIQKSFLANMNHIDYMSNYHAYLDNGEKLKVSVKNFQDIRNQYILWRGDIL